MRTALITTTINVPKVLELYRAHSEDVRFFVAIDKKTPEDAVNFCQYDVPNTNVCFIGDQEKYKCSDLIGWNTIARRNIAMLEALKWGADIIISIDDDNIPLYHDYFESFDRALSSAFNTYLGYTFDGIQATSESGWFDVGTLLYPISPHRGFPYVKRSENIFSARVGATVGVAAGICLGDPDVSASTRISNNPIAHRVSELLRSGIVVDPAGPRRPTRERVTDELGTLEIHRMTARGTWTVFNSQNTAIIRELAPAFLMVPQWGRYDDIFASLIVQRLMRERSYVVHFGAPYVWQQRNAHDLLRDLRSEQWGAEHILQFSAWLDAFLLGGTQRVTDQLRVMFTNLPDWMPERGKIQEMVLAWCEDCDEALK